jgi:LysR family hydrogen peroxide-inducible transcriptional activator
MHITLTELRYLIAVDKERHFGKAAKRAFVSQPTLSVAIRKLENELGVTVFERNRGEARVTPIGRRIIDQAYRVLGEVDTLEMMAEQGRDELQGPLRLGLLYTVGPYLLPHLIPHLGQTTPEMPLVIEENFIPTLIQQLRSNELDAVILSMTQEAPDLSVWPVYDETFVVVMPHNHPWTQRTAIEAVELANENVLLLGPEHYLREQICQLCHNSCALDESRNLHSGSSIETIRHLVAHGLGVTVLPSSSITHLMTDSRLLEARPFAGEQPRRRIAIAWRRGFPRPRAIAALRDAVMKYDVSGVQLLGDAAAVNVDENISDAS